MSSVPLSSVRPTDIQRPSSSSAMASKAIGIAPNIDELLNKDRSKKNGSLSSRRLSGSSGRQSEEAIYENAGSTNRWSHSTGSSVSNTNHRRHSSFSKRFSLGSSAFSPGFRSASPPKKRRAADTLSFDQSASPSEASPILPIRRFSPLKFPNFSNTSFGVEPQSNLDSMVSREAMADTAQRVDPGASGGQPGRLSPQKRTRENSSRSSPRLPNIAEADKTPPLPSSTTVLNSSANVQDSNSDSSVLRPLATNSRTSSPAKRRHHSSRENVGKNPSTSPPGRKRSSRDRDKKLILSKALSRANDAVNLDNEQDYVSAVSAYEEACRLLDTVMSQTTVEYERQKLRTIVNAVSLAL